LAAYLVCGLHEHNLVEFAAHQKITIDSYRIDDHYIAEMAEQELEAWLDGFEWPAEIDVQLGIVKSATTTRYKELADFALKHADFIGIPHAVQFAWEKWQQA